MILSSKLLHLTPLQCAIIATILLCSLCSENLKTIQNPTKTCRITRKHFRGVLQKHLTKTLVE